MALFHNASLLILKNLKRNLNFIVIKLKKIQPARPYSILHVYEFLKICQPACFFHSARLSERLEYLKCCFIAEEARIQISRVYFGSVL